MIPKPLKQSLKYNPLLFPKEHKRVIQDINVDLWNELSKINSLFPKEEIIVEHIIKDFGKTYGVDLILTCENGAVQQMLYVAYDRLMRLPHFAKHAHFSAMIQIDS